MFTDEMKPFILDLANIGYTSMSLKEVFSLSSGYSIRLLELMLQYRGFQKNGYITRFIELHELKRILDIENKPTYDRMVHLKSKVIDKAVNEINQLTRYTISYQSQKQGRKITGFTFLMHLPETLEKSKQPQEYIPSLPVKIIDDLIDAGIIADKAHKLYNDYGTNQLERNLTLWRQQKSKGRALGTGWLISAIENDYADVYDRQNGTKAESKERLEELTAEAIKNDNGTFTDANGTFVVYQGQKRYLS